MNILAFGISISIEIIILLGIIYLMLIINTLSSCKRETFYPNRSNGNKLPKSYNEYSSEPIGRGQYISI